MIPFCRNVKLEKLNPFFKNGIKSEAKNYRPISKLPFISKVTEKSIHDETEDYLHRNVLLCVYESGFGANQSIGTCLS